MPEIVSKALEILGFNSKEDELMNIRREILKKKNEFKRENGFDESKLRIPKRIFETASPRGKISENYIRQAVSAYFGKLNSD